LYAGVSCRRKACTGVPGVTGLLTSCYPAPIAYHPARGNVRRSGADRNVSRMADASRQNVRCVLLLIEKPWPKCELMHVTTGAR
jgi:hypothetical protein